MPIPITDCQRCGALCGVRCDAMRLVRTCADLKSRRRCCCRCRAATAAAWRSQAARGSQRKHTHTHGRLLCTWDSLATATGGHSHTRTHKRTQARERPPPLPLALNGWQLSIRSVRVLYCRLFHSRMLTPSSQANNKHTHTHTRRLRVERGKQAVQSTGVVELRERYALSPLSLALWRILLCTL